LLTFVELFFSSCAALIAENLFLRKQLALFQERKAKTPKNHGSDPSHNRCLGPISSIGEMR
jgi:hypothetical protein